MIIDATETIAGRIATTAAKAALQGEEVIIINCAQAYVTGARATTLAKYLRTRRMGVPSKGPFLTRTPEAIMKRTIRGMIPYKQPKGIAAMKRIKCYTRAPAEMKGTPITIKNAHISKLPSLKYVTLAHVCAYLGGKA